MGSSGDDHKNKKGLGFSDLLLWRQFTRDINPFHAQDDENGDADVAENDPLQITEDIVPDLRLPKETPRRATQPPQLDGRTEERLKKGKLAIEGRIDLHGMTQEQAQDALSGFLIAAHKAGKRCVLVITGKGKQKEESGDWTQPRSGILKQRVPEWIGSVPLRDIVLKTYPAQRKHGGDGALYIYLKRQR